MRKKLAALPIFLAAFFILAISVVRTASVKYVFSQEPSPAPVNFEELNIDYSLPEPGLAPDNIFWLVQAVIDMGESSPESYLENADVRLVAGKQMFENGKIEEAVAVLEKAELYLKQSYDEVVSQEGSPERNEFLYTLSLASLKHREILETILVHAPEDGRAVIARILDTPKIVYENSASELVSLGLSVPKYPF